MVSGCLTTGASATHLVVRKAHALRTVEKAHPRELDQPREVIVFIRIDGKVVGKSPLEPLADGQLDLVASHEVDVDATVAERLSDLFRTGVPAPPIGIDDDGGFRFGRCHTA